MTDELRQASAELVRLTGEVDRLRETVKTEERGLVELEVLPAEAAAKRTELRASLRQAEAELDRVRSNYDRLKAAWRHGSNP